MIIKSIEKAFAVLEFLAANGGMARLTDIAQAMNMSKTTVHNLLDTLKKLGYIDQNDVSPKYIITDRFLSLHAPIYSTPEIRDLVCHMVIELAKVMKVNAFVALQSGSYYYYDMASSPDGSSVNDLELGADQEMFHTAVGKIFIAFSPSLEKSLRKYYPGVINKSLSAELEQIRKSHFAQDIGAYDEKQNCVAVPLIYNHHLLAVLGLYGASDRFNQNVLDQAVLLLLRAVKELTEQIKIR